MIVTSALVSWKWIEGGFLDAVSDWGIILSLVYIACVLFDSVLLLSRISRGSFGTSEAEARELISYILHNSDKFEGGGGGFKIFEDPQQERQLAEEVYGAGATGAVT